MSPYKTLAPLAVSDENLVVDSLLKRCDAKDGLQDGMIFNTKACAFDPSALRCTGPKNNTCLSAPQVTAIQRAFAAPKDSRGIQLYPGFPYDTGINATKGIPGLLAPGSSPVGPANPVAQNVDLEEEAARQPLVDSIATNLSTFSGHGGKLLFYHGTSDPWFSPLDTLDYYNRLSDAASWSRFYFVPGMGHCGGGEKALDHFDMLGAIVNWAEKGIAPDFVTATGKAFPGRTRPLCAYPKYAHYNGQGDAENGANFTCRN